ncbi:MAG: hypothetical protein K9N49_07440 [Candidatus Marinimicrobia bacterium]|nr:hypothetical protein [Candidatus Neomarinimicrobiota bacterium]
MRTIRLCCLLTMLARLATAAAEEALPRDPFWPVGYEPPPVAAPAPPPGPARGTPVPRQAAPDWAGARAAVRVSGISQFGNEAPRAIINGQWVAQGETVIVNHDQMRYEFVVSAITSAGVRVAANRILPAAAPEGTSLDADNKGQE